MYNINCSCFAVLKVTLIMKLDFAMAWLLKRVLWRYVSVEFGEVCVTTTGTTKMHLLSAESWDIQQQVTKFNIKYFDIISDTSYYIL